MLRVFICEDNKKHLSVIKKHVENHIIINNLAMQLVCASANPTDILNYLEKNPHVAGLYFLDLDLGCETDGISLAEAIRKYDPRGFIVFITADAESHKLTFKYKVEALDYIVKDGLDIKERISESIDNAMLKFTSKTAVLQDSVVFRLSKDIKKFFGDFNLAKDSIVSIGSAKILFFITNPDIKHAIIAYTTDGRLEFSGNLRQVEAELDMNRFYRCQQNLIVNLDKVLAVDPVQCKLLMETNITVDIAARQVKKLMERVAIHKTKS